ncbi:hypothetical protein B4U80_14538 [Leptotrombidium deliense]|uniref:C-type lectin domain-containing protein n=1 Tax=Leptotrombidium deliense TaxID=299467 RepID=A0A443RUL5_9ACAR|nr:hypothetical protein B4U80_14538 [Leptotrombidium deliense]
MVRRDYYDMKRYCESLGGSLLYIRSREDDNMLRGKYFGKYAYLGMRYNGYEIKNDDGSYPAYHCWKSWKPDSEKPCTNFDTTDGYWVKCSCYDREYTTCQFSSCWSILYDENRKRNSEITDYVQQQLQNTKSSTVNQLTSSFETKLNENSNQIYERLNLTLMHFMERFHASTPVPIK